MSAPVALTPAPASAAPRGSIAFGALWNLLAGVWGVLFGLATNIVLARWLGPDYKGQVDLFSATVALGSQVFGLSLASGVTYVVAAGGIRLWRLAAVLTAVSAVQAMLLGFALALLAHTPAITALLPSEWSTWGPIAATGAVFGLLLTGYWRAILHGLRRFATSALLDAATRALVAGAMIAGVLWCANSPSRGSIAAALGSLAATATIALVCPVLVGHHFRTEGPRTGVRRAFAYSLPCYLGNLVQFLNYRLDVFLVAYYVGPRALALYATAVGLGQLLWLPSLALQSVLFPTLTSMTDNQQRIRIAAQGARILLLMSLVLAAVLAAVAPWLIGLLFGPAFAGSAPALWLLLPGIVVLTASQQLATFPMAIGRPQLNLIAAFVGLLATLVFNAILIPKIGFLGAAIASTVSYSLTMLTIAWICSSLSGVPLWALFRVRWSDGETARRLLVEFLRKGRRGNP